MKPVWKKVAIIVAAAFAGGAGYAWHSLSGEAVASVRASIDRYNQAERRPGLKASVGYATISRSRFPSLGARVVNPSFDFEDSGEAGGRSPLAIHWKHEGDIEIVSMPRDFGYRITSRGRGNTAFETAGKAFEVASKDAVISAEITSRDKAGYERLGSLNSISLADKEALKAFLLSLHSVTIDASLIELTSADGSVAYYSQDSSSLHITNRSDPSVVDAEVTLQLANSEVSKEYDGALREFITALGIPMLDVSVVPFAASRAGKQNVDLAFSVRLPITGPRDEFPESYLHIKRLELNNDFYRFSAPLDVAAHNGQDGHMLRAKGNLRFELTNTGGDELRRINQNPEIALSQLGHETAANPAAGSSLPVLPELDKLGPITLDIDLDLSAPYIPKDAPPRKHASQGPRESLVIRALSFNHARWGIELEGMASRASKGEFMLDFNLVCGKCMALVGDAFDRTEAWQTAAGEADKQSLAEKRSKVEALLKDIGKPDESTGDIAFGIGTPQANDIRINDKPLSEVMPRVMDLFRPSFPKPGNPDELAPKPPVEPAAKP